MLRQQEIGGQAGSLQQQWIILIHHRTNISMGGVVRHTQCHTIGSYIDGHEQLLCMI